MSGAKVSMKNAKAEDKQPQVVILGRKDAVAKAKELVLAKLPIVGRLEILESEVGAVIGQKGKGIQELDQRAVAAERRRRDRRDRWSARGRAPFARLVALKGPLPPTLGVDRRGPRGPASDSRCGGGDL